MRLYTIHAWEEEARGSLEWRRGGKAGHWGGEAERQGNVRRWNRCVRREGVEV